MKVEKRSERKQKRQKEELTKKYGIKVKGLKVVIDYFQQKKKISAKSMQAPPNAEEVKEFWSKLWKNAVPYNDDVECLKEIELELKNVNIQENVETTK